MSHETRDLARHDRVVADVVADQSLYSSCVAPLMGFSFSMQIVWKGVHSGDQEKSCGSECEQAF
jgi:hypothetical protein